MLCDACHIAKQIHVEGMATMSACPRFDGVWGINRMMPLLKRSVYPLVDLFFPEFPIGQPSILATVQQPQIASSSSLLQHSYAWVTTVTTIVATIHHPFWWDMWYIYIYFLPVKAHNNTCLVYTKFNALSYGYKLSFFLGALSLYMVWRTFSTQLDPPVYAYFDRISYGYKILLFLLPTS